MILGIWQVVKEGGDGDGEAEAAVSLFPSIICHSYLCQRLVAGILGMVPLSSPIEVPWERYQILCFDC